jgi:hypothetical protein
MQSSPYVEIARQLLAAGLAHKEPTRSREVAARLREDGHPTLAATLELATARKTSWPGASASG